MQLIRDWLRQKFVVEAESSSGVRPGEESCAFGSTKYFLLCGLGGIVSCGSTHTLITPLDLIKCRLQVFPEKNVLIFRSCDMRATRAPESILIV